MRHLGFPSIPTKNESALKQETQTHGLLTAEKCLAWFNGCPVYPAFHLAPGFPASPGCINVPRV